MMKQQNTQTQPPDEWMSENGNWKIHKPDFRAGKWFIENLKTGFGDSPHIHPGGVAYDYPEAIPQYVKNRLCRMAAGMF
jgi:hypothetical protein